MKNLIVYGVPAGGVFGLRQLRKRWPDSTICVVAPRTDIGYYSTCYNRFFEANNAEEMLLATHDAMAFLGEAPTDAYIYSNRMLEYILEAGEELFAKLHFENSYTVFEQIIDKAKADQLCRSLMIPRPAEYDLLQLDANQITFPVVVKPLAKQQAKGASKCQFLDCASDLTAYLSKMQASNIALSNLVCQQLIQGDNRFEYGYGGYFLKGKPKVDICFHQFRQMPQGLCCYIREVTNQELNKALRELVLPFVEHLQYTGFIEFDVKQDAATGQLYVLDINPRPWGSVDMLVAKLGNSTVYAPQMSSNSVEWYKPILVWRAFMNKRNAPYSICRHIANGRFVRVAELYDRSDKKPFVRALRNQLIGMLYVLKHSICG